MSLPPLDIKAILNSSGIQPKKGLGQNFLCDETILKKIVESAEVGPEDTVLEIGAGLGSLTRHLALSAKWVSAVEIDRRMMPFLGKVQAQFYNVDVFRGDILILKPESLGLSGAYIVVANIPYYITSAIIRHLLESGNKPRRIILTVQEEVAERICAKPGDMNLLALSVQVYGDPKILFSIPSAAFYPEPDVDSCVIRVDLLQEPRIPLARLDTFFKLAKTAFSQKRKTLRNSLAGGSGLAISETSPLLIEAGIEPKRRAETLSLEEWGKITDRFLAKQK